MVSKLDSTLRLTMVGILFIWTVLYGSAFEVPYSRNLVELHAVPAWRFALALAVLAAAYWCPRVGILAALAIFFYFSDLEKLTTPFADISAKQ